MNRVKPGGSQDVAGKLLRPRIKSSLPFKTIDSSRTLRTTLVKKIFHLGADVLLTNASEGVPHYHRLRNSLNPKLWKWRVLCGWSWKPSEGTVAEHINRLEIRAIGTGLRWRLFKHRSFGSNILHLVDTIVRLQIITKDRTSSRKLRSVCKRIAAWQLCGNLLLTLGYTASKTNPADAPPRRARKRKWGSVK